MICCIPAQLISTGLYGPSDDSRLQLADSGGVSSHVLYIVQDESAADVLPARGGSSGSDIETGGTHPPPSTPHHPPPPHHLSQPPVLQRRTAIVRAPEQRLQDQTDSTSFMTEKLELMPKDQRHLRLALVLNHPIACRGCSSGGSTCGGVDPHLCRRHLLSNGGAACYGNADVHVWRV